MGSDILTDKHNNRRLRFVAIIHAENYTKFQIEFDGKNTSDTMYFTLYTLQAITNNEHGTYQFFEQTNNKSMFTVHNLL